MEAIRYVRLLENLGIEKSSLRFLHFNPMLRSPYRARWKSVLGLSWRHRSQVIFINPPFRRSASSDRWLAILPPFHAAPEERASDLLKGFHFLMVMAAIVYGFRSS
jgi:hypothetical protein